MRWWLPAFFSVLALSGQTTTSDAAAGAKTFRSHCAECHGLGGEGGRGPNLTTGIYYHGSSDEELLKNISDGIPGTEMPGLFYSPDRVRQVVAYLRSLSANANSKMSGDQLTGQSVYRSSGGAQCHRVGLDGGKMGPDLTEIGKIRSVSHLRQAVLDPSGDVRQRYWVAKFVTDEGKNVSGFVMNEDTYSVQIIDFKGSLYSYSKSGLKDYRVEKTSAMPSYKAQLVDRQVDDLVAYLSSLRSRGGTK